MKSNKEAKQRIPFSQRLFWSVFLLFLAFTVCFFLFQYQRERDFAQEKLHSILHNYNYQLHNRLLSQTNTDSVVDDFIHDIPQKDLRVTIIDPSGNVLYDNSGKDVFDNHNNRSEVHLARAHHEGFTIRSSGSTGKRYFYSASSIDKYIYRTALPYDPYVKNELSLNMDLIYFMMLMVIFFFIVLSRFTFSIDKTVSRLRDFARKVEEGKMPDTDYEFPNDELGDISQNMINLYHKQESVKEEDDRRKRQLTQNVAHELKTPVSSIQGYLETILSNPEMAVEQKEYFLERCYSQSTRLTDLLRDISVLNRLDEATEMFELTEVNISFLLEEIEKECTPEMEEKNISSSIIISGSPIIEGNHSLLYSIFRNLFDNSIAYAGEGSRITVECYKEDAQYYYFRFSDNGIGIAEEHLNRIFERFYRIDKGRSRKLGGTGLGLAIVKNGVLFHKGQISVQSGTGNGTIFQFSLRKKVTDN